jgi:acetyltransferase-like isoleucine patch superfamily enzyme
MSQARDREFAGTGEDVTIYPSARILSTSNIRIGSHVIIDDFVFIGKHEKLVLGNHVHIASHASITGGGIFLCCDFAGISSGARILTGTDDFHGSGLTGPTIPPRYRAVERGRVVLGAHVVIGANAIVLPNVNISEGAVVGAGSVVTKDLDPWGVYVGAPARRVTTRPSERILEYERRLVEEEGLSQRFRDATSFDASWP